jgi:fibronectin type 3 domain-containing protein
MSSIELRHRGRRRSSTLALTAALSVGMVLSGIGAHVATTRALAADPPPKRVLSDPNPNFSGVWVDTTNNELVVADDNKHNILVYARTATGAAAPLRSIGGLATGIDYPSQVVVDLANNEVWAVDDDTADRAVVFSRTANGNVAPLRTIDFKNIVTTDERRTWGWAVDAVNNEVAGTWQNGSEVKVLDRIAGEPLRSIKGSLTGLGDPHGVFIDNLNNEILVANEGHNPAVAPPPASITVFDRLANGNVAPLRTIQGPLTGLSQPKQLHVDTLNNEIAVANAAGSIAVFARTATGNIAPLRTIAGALTGLSSPTGVFIDSVNNEIVVGNWGNHTVTVYPRTATGNVAPVRTITSGASALVGFGNPGAMAADPTNGEFYVTNCVSHPRIAAFSRLASGQTAPIRTIEGQNTRISRSLHGIAFDGVNGEIIAPSTLEDAILVFNRLDSGDVAPKRVIQGPASLINKPQGIAVDTTNNEIAVANEGVAVGPPVIPASITVYGRLATGNIAPLRQITNASLSKPVGIWIDAVNNEILVADGTTAAEAILVFSRTANGAATPLRTISGAATMLSKTRQLILDGTSNEIYIASQGDRSVNPPQFGSIGVFNRLDSGNVAPKRFLQHATASFVEHPRSIWLDLSNNELGVGDSKLNEVRVFDRLFGAAPPAPPAAPTGLTATPGNAQVSLAWTASGGATSYNVKRATVTGGPYTVVATGVTAASFTDTGLVNGTTYFHVVSAVNAGGESANSNQTSATPTAPPPGPPPPPTGLTATAGNAQVTLSWTASAGATSHNIKRATVTGGPYLVIATGVTATNFTNTGVVNGTTYFFVVSASNANGESANSNEASATPAAGAPPAAPTGLAAVGGATSISLTWTASAGATSYTVRRATVSGGPYAIIATGLTATNYTDATVTIDTLFFYVVTAVNANGESPNSNEASAAAG